jgi:hypothetical protein
MTTSPPFLFLLSRLPGSAGRLVAQLTLACLLLGQALLAHAIPVVNQPNGTVSESVEDLRVRKD